MYTVLRDSNDICNDTVRWSNLLLSLRTHAARIANGIRDSICMFL